MAGTRGGSADCDAKVQALRHRIQALEAEAVEHERTRQLLSEQYSFRKAVIERAAEGLAVCHAVADHPFVRFTVWNPRMTDITGSEICWHLRDKGHRFPILLISGLSADHPEIKKLLKLRKTFLLQKPFSFRDMSDLVTIALGETLIEEAPRL